MANVSDQPQPTPVEQPPAKSRGCLYGCLFVAGTIVALTLCAGFAGYWFVSKQVAKYTSDTPVELPRVEYTAEQLAQLETRLETFSKAVEQGESPEEDLVLTAEEINAMITKEEKLRGRVFIKIDDGQVTGDLSLPTDALPGGKGRYFNGSASFKVSMENGVLIVTLADAEVNGEQVPQQAIDSMAGENLAKDLYKDPKNAKVLRRIESVSIGDDKIILKMRHDEADGEAETESPQVESETPADVQPSTDDGPANKASDASSPETSEAAKAPPQA